MAQTSRTQAERERFEGLALRWLALASDYDATNSLLANWGVAQHGSVAQTHSCEAEADQSVGPLDHPMSKPSADLTEKSVIRVALDGERLIVTMGDTADRAVFFKHPDEPRLVEASGLAVDKGAPRQLRSR